MRSQRKKNTFNNKKQNNKKQKQNKQTNKQTHTHTKQTKQTKQTNTKDWTPLGGSGVTLIRPQLEKPSGRPLA
jgi:hypothetical protein